MIETLKFQSILSQPHNQICYDCGTPNPTYTSINNGVLICQSCAQKHMNLNNMVSTVKTLQDDNWSDDEIRFLMLSGNSRFNQMTQEFHLPFDKTFDYKYSTIAANYYRKLVYSELTNSEPPLKPDITTGQKLMTEEMYKEQSFLEKLKKNISYVGEKISEKTKQAYQATVNFFTKNNKPAQETGSEMPKHH
jgi:hypothetical protein